MAATKKLFQGEVVRNEKVVIMGGSHTAIYLAQILEHNDMSVKILDWEMNRSGKSESPGVPTRRIGVASCLL